MVTRWAIALLNLDFTVKKVAGKLNVVPDTLSRLFTKVEEEPLPREPALASICRNVPNGWTVPCTRPERLPSLSPNLDDVDIVRNDSELFASAVPLFPLLDPEKILGEQRAKIGSYIDYVKAPVIVAVSGGETETSMSYESLFLE